MNSTSTSPVGKLWKKGELTNALEERKVQRDDKQEHSSGEEGGEVNLPSFCDSLFEGEEEWEEG